MAKCKACGKRIPYTERHFLVADDAGAQQPVCESCVYEAVRNGTVLSCRSGTARVMQADSATECMPQQAYAKKKKRTWLTVLVAVCLLIASLAVFIKIKIRNQIASDLAQMFRDQDVPHINVNDGTITMPGDAQVPVYTPKPIVTATPVPVVTPAPSPTPTPTPAPTPTPQLEPGKAFITLRDHICENGEQIDERTFIIPVMGVRGYDYYLLADREAGSMLSLMLDWPETGYSAMLTFYTDETDENLLYAVLFVDAPTEHEGRDATITLTGTIDPKRYTAGASIMADDVFIDDGGELYDATPEQKASFADTLTNFGSLAVSALASYTRTNLGEDFLAYLGFTAY